MNFALFLFFELAYVAAVRILLRKFTGTEIQLELFWTGIRIVSLVCLAFLFSRVAQRTPGQLTPISPGMFSSMGVFIIPVFVGDMGLHGDTRYVFAATSVVVGLREELAYRGLLQTLITRRLGISPALAISNIAFIAYHFGVQPFTLSWVLQSFILGLIFGYRYHITGSILFISFLHAGYDAIYSFTPILSRPGPDYVGVLICLLVFVALLASRKKPNK
jgi:membrane protease YdiL (CAAX protease family)